MPQIETQGVTIVDAATELPTLETTEQLHTPLTVEDGQPKLVVQRLATTMAFERDTEDPWIQQSITCIPDPLGINGETLIGQRRTERPKAEASPPPAARLGEETFKALFPIFAHDENEWLLTALIEGIDNPNILGWLYQQLDAISDRRRVENLKKKILLNPAVPQNILKSKCIFCNVTQRQVIDSLGRHNSAVSIYNDYPFAPLMHKVLLLQEPKHDISEITAEEVRSFYELLFTKITPAAYEQFGDELDGFTYGMNYGLPRIHKGRQVIASGASQPHLHSQVGALGRSSFNAADRLGRICRAYRDRWRRDYLADYLVALKAANLVLDEDDNAVLYVPIAQRFNYEVQIMVKNPVVGNIRDTTPEIRRSIGSLEHRVYMMYQHQELQIESFNTVMYATRFSAHNDYGQRLVISINPRTTIIALSELANRNVVDAYPWAAAAVLNGIKEQIDTKGPKKLSILAIGAHPDDIELGCGGLLLELKKRGHEINALIVTDGSGGPGRVPEVREKEASAAAAILGVSTIFFGRIGDGRAHQGDALYNVIESQIARHRPDIVITHAHIASEHSDHKNVCDAVRTVCARQRPQIYPLMYEVSAYSVDSSFQPTFYVQIDSSMDAKIQAIRAHRSEIERKPSPVDLEKMTQRSALRGNQVGSGTNYAEAFVCDAPHRDKMKMEQWMPFLSMP